MRSPKNKTQQHRTKVKNLSAMLAIGLAIVTLFQAGNVKSEKASSRSTMEATLIAEVDDWFANEEMELEDLFLAEAVNKAEYFKVFDAEGELIMAGDPQQSTQLRQLVNRAEFMSTFCGQQYYAFIK